MEGKSLKVTRQSRANDCLLRQEGRVQSVAIEKFRNSSEKTTQTRAGGEIIAMCVVPELNSPPTFI
eukprot:1252277-Amphidinium_carterae.1